MRELDQKVEKRSQDRTHRDTGDAEAFRKDGYPDHDPDLIHCRSQSGEEEITVCVQDPHDQPADPEDQDRG